MYRRHSLAGALFAFRSSVVLRQSTERSCQYAMVKKALEFAWARAHEKST